MSSYLFLSSHRLIQRESNIFVPKIKRIQTIVSSANKKQCSFNNLNLHTLHRRNIYHQSYTRISKHHINISLGFTTTTCVAYILQRNSIPSKCEHVDAINTLNDHYDNGIVLSSSLLNLEDETLIQKAARKISNIFKLFLDAVLVAIRTTEICVRLSPLLVLTPAAMLKNSDDSVLSDIAWKYSLYTVQKLGPAFIKLCQWAGTRRDLFPQHICDRLSILNDCTHLHDWEHTDRILKDSFGENGCLQINPNDIIGSGSVAQVYRGILSDPKSGEKRTVAVKVLHPNIIEKVERDLALMKRVSSLLDALPFEIIKMLSLPRATENFAQILRRQVDMTIEGSNLKQFRDNFDSQHKCSFPQPIMFSKCCLVEEYIDAKPISHFLFDESVEGREIRKKIAGPLLRAFLKMVFVDNFVHCDLHPGNVLVHENTTTRTPIPTSNSPFSFLLAQNEDKTLNHQETNYSVVFLDAGIATSLNKRDQTNLKDLFRAILLNDGALAGRLMVERARYENCSSKEGGVEAFSQGIADIVTEFHTRRKEGLTLGVVRIGSLLGQVLDLCRIHGVEIDPAMANIVISTFVLEGLGRSLEPNLNLFDCALPFVMGKV